MLDEAIDYLKSLQLQLQVLNASYHMHKLVTVHNIVLISLALLHPLLL